MKKTLQILSISVFLISFSSCDKYDNGGTTKKAEANLTNIWQIESYLVDGTDKTGDLLISNFEETFADNGVYTRFYKDGASADVSETGTWVLAEENANVNFSGAGAVDLTTTETGVSTSSYLILKLTKKEFWYSFTSGNSSHEFRMKAKS